MKVKIKIVFSRILALDQLRYTFLGFRRHVLRTKYKQKNIYWKEVNIYLILLIMFASEGFMVVWWLALSPHNNVVLGLNPSWDLSV